MKRQLPKNVRQIGNVSDSSKIYVEDYVDTFFNQLCDKADQGMTGAFLIGETVQEEGQDYIYVYGAIQMKELGVKGKDFIIEESVWKNACETCKEFFEDAEILGWFIAGGENDVEVNHNIKKMHQKFFRRENSLFVTKNAREKEEKFYIYRFRDLMECAGHYVYYEKNLEMQNYMIASRKRSGFTPSEIIEDRVTKSFRKLIKERNEENEQKAHSRLVYGLSTFLVLVILIIGVTMINNYDKMRNVQKSLDEISESVAKTEKEEETVETMGDITPPDKETEKEETQEELQEEQEESKDDGTEEEPSPNDVPVIETPDTTPNKTYIVQEGDTLQSICQMEYGDTTQIEEICKLNQLEDGNLIYIGQKLLLP